MKQCKISLFDKEKNEEYTVNINCTDVNIIKPGVKLTNSVTGKEYFFLHNVWRRIEVGEKKLKQCLYKILIDGSKEYFADNVIIDDHTGVLVLSQASETKEGTTRMVNSEWMCLLNPSQYEFIITSQTTAGRLNK